MAITDDKTRLHRATELWAWHDASHLDRLKPARRKLKRAERIFRQLGIARQGAQRG